MNQSARAALARPYTTWNMEVSKGGQQAVQLVLVLFGIVSTEDADVRRLDEGWDVCRGEHALGKYRVQRSSWEGAQRCMVRTRSACPGLMWPTGSSTTNGCYRLAQAHGLIHNHSSAAGVGAHFVTGGSSATMFLLIVILW